jgi:hypothetical protein
MPEPSLPTGIGMFNLGCIAPIEAAGTSMVIFESSTLRVLISPGPSNSPRSEGLIGVAWTSINTSLSPGTGLSDSKIAISSFP